MGAPPSVHLVEACYELDSGPEQWLERVVRALLPLLDTGLGAQGAVVRRTGYGQLDFVARVHLGPPETRAFMERLFAKQRPEAQEAYFRRTPLVDVAHEEMEAFGPEATEAYLAANPPGVHIVDHVGLSVRDGSDYGVAVSAFSKRRIEVSNAQRGRYRRLICHMAAGWRLVQRASLAGEEAVLSPDGRCLHAEGPAREKDARSVLRQAVRHVDRARGPLSRRDPDEALALWKGLVKGRWSLVDRFESDGRRYVVAHRNDPRFDDPRKLTARERQCARLAAQGHTNAEIAYALGLEESTAGSHVVSATRKLGLERRTQLADAIEPAPWSDARVADLDADGALRAVSVPGAAAVPGDAGLSPSEQAVARGIREGQSNQAIARARGTAERTVANQVQSIFRKLGVASRAELVAKLRRREQ